MIHRRDTPAPFLQRPDPSSSSSFIQTAQPFTFGTPVTPQQKYRPKRARLHRPSPEPYSSTTARGSADETQDERISHDLSMTNVRHSVVDHMLMSLNPDQLRSLSQPVEQPRSSAGSDLVNQQRHLHPSSISSDFAAPPEDSPNRRSHQFGRGRRSNSSSNFQSALRRIDSVHVNDEEDPRRARAFQAQRAGGIERPSRGGRHSNKSSGSGSVDLGQMLGGPRLPHSLGGRSTSFDHGYGERLVLPSGSHPALPNSHSQPDIYDNIEAAPTPTVPAGPRRDRSPVFIPQTMPTASGSHPQLQRKNSNKSAKSHITKKNKGDAIHWDAPVLAANGRRASSRDCKQIAPVPTFMRPHAPSPGRHYSESMVRPRQGSRQESNVHAKDLTRDRPGFFKRMFGSSRGPLSPNDLQLPASQSLRDGARANSRSGQSSTSKLHKPGPFEDFSSPQPDATHPPLGKKPSSFFRRRKKSVSENNPPPVLPLHRQHNAHFEPAQQSPTSSLRQVMNPFLDSPVRPPQFSGPGHSVGARESATTAPLANRLQSKPSMEQLRPATERMLNADPSPPFHHSRDLPSPKSENSNSRIRLHPDDELPLPTNNSSFHDESTIEFRAPKAGSKMELTHKDPATPDRAPKSTPFHMTPQRTSSKNAVPESDQKVMEASTSQSVLSTRNINAPSSTRAQSTTNQKAEPRDWLTASQATPTRNQPSPPNPSVNPDRVWLEPASSDWETGKAEMSKPVEGAEVSPVSEYHSASSTLHPLKVQDDIPFPEPTAEDTAPKLSVDIDSIQPTEADRVKAKQLFDGDETLVPKLMAAAWLGEPSVDRVGIRQAYMELFDWQEFNILAALRRLCGKLYLKGEAQQVDRILDAFTTRWWACNRSNGFKASDVVHTICYSVLLLNTDLHQAEIETKMTRTQFLKNIMPTIRRVVKDAAPDAFVNGRASTLPSPRVCAEPPSSGSKSSTVNDPQEPRRSFEAQRPMYRLSQRPSDQATYVPITPHTALDYTTGTDCGPLVKTPFHGKLSTWENQIEIVLKDFYNSIRQQPLPLHGAEAKEIKNEPQPSLNGISAMTSNMLRRTPSVLSKAGSETLSYSRGRPSENRLGTGRWQSKTRSRPRVNPASSVASTRRSSYDENSSVTSPSVMSAWSKFSSLGRNQTNMSIDSLASNFPQGGYQQSIGFANALSQAIIREEGSANDDENLRAAPLLEDESLELAGAPWAKEGILKHKHHLEYVDKRAKDRGWAESFAVVEKGYLRLFSFSMNAKSLRQKAKNQRAPGGVVGGGNWADSAEVMGSFLLRQTIASALPPPGYSKTRPHVWALSLPTGAVHLFQVGTPEIVKEFVTTANYWSARLSKEPLVGGISNIEYGWGDSVINAALVHAENQPSSTTLSGARPSLQGSIRSARSSMDQSNYRPKLPGDKIVIHDWKPPQQSMVASVLMEVDQLKALSTYVKNIEEELQKHNELRSTMLLTFSPRHPNSTKAMSNWERKSSYLLREIVKFRTYIDCLQGAQAHKERLYVERAKAEAATSAGEIGTVTNHVVSP